MEYKIRKISIEDFFRTAEQTMFRISPNGDQIACLKPYKTRLNVFIKDFNSNEFIRITRVEDRSISDFRWANDSRIVYMKDNGGDENFRLYAVDIDGNNFLELTPFEGVRTRIVDELIYDKNHILIEHNKRDRGAFDVYKVNVYTGEMETVVNNPGGVVQWNIDHHGNVRVGLALDGLNRKILYRESINDDFRVILEGDHKENAEVLCFAEDNKNLIIASNIGRDKYAIYEFDPIAKEHCKLLYENLEVDVKEVVKSRKYKKVVGATYNTNKICYEFLDESINEIYSKIKERLPRENVLFRDMSSEENKLIILANSDKNPGSIYLYNTIDGSLEMLAKVKPWINEEEMSEVKPIKYTSRDGLTIHGYLTIPRGSEPKNLPIVVVPHGGPWARNMWNFRNDGQFLANRGYGILEMNFRGSTGYGRKFKEAGFKQWGKTMQNDITDGVNWLIKEGIANPKRIAIYGISYGGYATLAGLAFTPDLYTCGVDVVGPSNLFTVLEDMPAYWESMRRMMYEMMGDPEVDKELLREASPLFHVDNIKKPLFVVQGAKDPRVPQREADQIVQALRAKGTDVKYMLKENEGHGFRNQENIVELYGEIEKFLEEHMK